MDKEKDPYLWTHGHTQPSNLYYNNWPLFLKESFPKMYDTIFCTITYLALIVSNILLFYEVNQIFKNPDAELSLQHIVKILRTLKATFMK